MQIELKNSFTRDLKKLYGNQSLIDSVYEIIQEIQASDSLAEISDLVKLRGYRDYYRIKLGGYRIGLKYSNNKITLFCMLPRQIVYQQFP